MRRWGVASFDLKWSKCTNDPGVSGTSTPLNDPKSLRSQHSDLWGSPLSIGVNAVTPFYMVELWHEILMSGSPIHNRVNSSIHPSLGYSRAPMMVLEDCLVHVQMAPHHAMIAFFSSIGGMSSPMPSTRQRQNRGQSNSRARTLYRGEREKTPFLRCS